MRPTSRWSGTSPTRTDPPLRSPTLSRRSSRPSTKLSKTSRATACACTCAGVTRNRRTTAMFRWKTSSRPYSKPTSAASYCHSPTPATAHEFRCFKAHPLKDDQILVAGVIDSLTNFVEHPEVVADRIERVAAVIGDPSRVLAGTDCGFDTSAGWGRVASDVVSAKLTSLRDGARIASGRLLR